MKYLLDTNVLSEWTKPRPHKNVILFLQSERAVSFFISEVSVVEIERGIGMLAETAYRARLKAWANEQVRERFAERYLKLDRDVIAAVLDLAAMANRKRASLPIADALIAATAVSHNLVIVTRNIKDFRVLDIPMLNPFTGERFNGA